MVLCIGKQFLRCTILTLLLVLHSRGLSTLRLPRVRAYVAPLQLPIPTSNNLNILNWRCRGPCPLFMADSLVDSEPLASVQPTEPHNSNTGDRNEKSENKVHRAKPPRSLKTTLKLIYMSVVKLISSKLKYSSTRNLNLPRFPKPPDTIRRMTRTRQGLLQLVFSSMLMMIFIASLVKKRSSIVELSYANFMKMLDKYPEQIKHIVVSSQTLTLSIEGKTVFTRIVPVAAPLLTKLLESGVDFSAAPSPKNVIGIVSSVIYLGMMFRLFKAMQGPRDEAVGKTRDKMNLSSYGNLSFDDVAGQNTAKLEVKEVVEMLKDSSRYRAIGARIPSGVLLNGPPGTGKTLLARVTAAEARVPFFACSASDFVEVFVGRGPARVRKLFKTAAECAPCIVFIDEIDSIGRSRKSGNINSEQENTLNQLLTCMDGLDTSNNGVIVMAATNRLDVLDPALLRAGRFDRIVQCPLPDRIGREEILNVQCKRLRIGEDVNLERIARMTPGTSGADLGTIVNEAAIRTVRRQAEVVCAEDFGEALKSFYSTRSINMAGLAEVAGDTTFIPNWFKNLVNWNNEVPSSAPAANG